jgi:conjugative transfer region protein TrbK
MGRANLFRIAAIALLIASVLAALVASKQRRATPVPEPAPIVSVGPLRDLTDELRRCRALGPQDAENPHCVAVWEENRRRFFGKPARPLPPPPPGTAAPATNPSGETHG